MDYMINYYLCNGSKLFVLLNVLILPNSSFLSSLKFFFLKIHKERKKERKKYFKEYFFNIVCLMISLKQV